MEVDVGEVNWCGGHAVVQGAMDENCLCWLHYQSSQPGFPRSRELASKPAHYTTSINTVSEGYAFFCLALKKVVMH